MLWLYCLPGRMFAVWSYLWPVKGNAVGSARRRNSRLAHFIDSTVIWAVLAYIAYGVLTTPEERAQMAESVEQAMAAQ